MRKKKLKACILVILLTVLPLLTQSCATTRTVYIYDTPAVPFPVFPVPTETKFDGATNTVSVPVDWYIDLAEYKAQINAVENFYKYLREKENGKN